MAMLIRQRISSLWFGRLLRAAAATSPARRVVTKCKTLRDRNLGSKSSSTFCKVSPGALPGSYKGSVKPTAARRYDVTVVTLPSSQLALAFEVEVQPGPVDPYASTAEGGGLFAATVGQEATFSVSSSFTVL